MNNFDDLLRNLDLEYFGTGQHKISIEEAIKEVKAETGFFLDVRTKEELEYIQLAFAHNIPTNQIPDRLEEIPKNKTIIVFCSSTTRATIVSVYLQLNGYEHVKIMMAKLGDLAGNFMPGYVYKNK